MKDDKDLPNLIVYITSFIVIHLLHSITSIHLHMLAAAFFFLVYKRFGDTIKITRNFCPSSGNFFGLDIAFFFKKSTPSMHNFKTKVNN